MRVVRKLKVKDSEVVLEVSPEQAFWVHDGPTVKSLKELSNAIAEMSPEQFAYHTMRNGNDFARWIRDVLQNSECANKIEMAENQKETLKVISKYL